MKRGIEQTDRFELRFDSTLAKGVFVGFVRFAE
jgi:hypothetical protein